MHACLTLPFTVISAVPIMNFGISASWMLISNEAAASKQSVRAPVHRAERRRDPLWSYTEVKGFASNGVINTGPLTEHVAM